MTPPAPSILTPSEIPVDSVEVWLTLEDESKKLNREPDLTFSAGASASTRQIEVDPGVLYQRFEGAGAAMTDSSAWLIMNVLDDPARQQLMRNLFTRQGEGIGLSYLRIPMGASDFALGDYTYADLPVGQVDPTLSSFSVEHDKASILPALQMALELNPQLRFMGSPWSPPAWMKKDNQLHGSSLLPEYFQAFADYHVRFVQAYAAEGIPIDTLTPQNEPLHTTSGYPTMFMSAVDQQAFVRDHLGPALDQAGLDTRILIFDHNWDLADYPLEVLADPKAAAYVDGVAFHCYGGDVSAQSRVHEQHPTKGTWFTECSGGGWATDFGDNLRWNLHNLVIGNFRNWGNSLLLWNLALDENDGPQNGGCGNCRGVVTINQSSGEITYNEEYYILGHVTRFIDPGAYRADSGQSLANLPGHVAFLNPDGSLVLIVQSDSAATFDVTWNGRHFTYQFPSAGVATFKWDANARPGPTVTAAPISTSTPRPSAAAPGTVPASNLLVDFETPASTVLHSVSNASASLGDIAHTGQYSLLSESDSGQWHVVGVNLASTPLDLSGFQKICFWVYDTTEGGTGNADNTIGLRLVDSLGSREEHWTDHAGVGPNPRTIQNTWVQVCLNLSAYPQVDLTSVVRVEFNTYWAGLAYFDDISVEGSAP